MKKLLGTGCLLLMMVLFSFPVWGQEPPDVPNGSGWFIDDRADPSLDGEGAQGIPASDEKHEGGHTGPASE